MNSTAASSLLLNLRRQYHQNICANILGSRTFGGPMSVADSSSRASTELAAGMAANMNQPLCSSPTTGQASGSNFTLYTKQFLQDAFTLLEHLRPGNWIFSTSQVATGIAVFDQYEHLAQLAALMRDYPAVKAALDNGYFITPDITISRTPVSEREIDAVALVVQTGEDIAKLNPLRAANAGSRRSNAILHASISCKWSMRSDRAQNTRTEALNLIRNRKGRTPHIVAVTLEPLPARIASLALGTGDVDCVYHAALYELYTAAENSKYSDAYTLLKDMIDGNRLRDISDLPFDLAV